jgi:hypothetical protein
MGSIRSEPRTMPQIPHCVLLITSSCCDHASHHLPLCQDKAVTPTSLKDIFTPIWAGPLVEGLCQSSKLAALMAALAPAT